MVDIPKFVRAKTKQGAVRRIEDIRVLLATNSRASEDDEYKQLMNTLIRAAGLRPEVKFDREKFEHCHTPYHMKHPILSRYQNKRAIDMLLPLRLYHMELFFSCQK